MPSHTVRHHPYAVLAASSLDRVLVANATWPFDFMADESVHLILSDIPYGIGAEDWDVLHENTNAAYLGSSPAQEKAGTVFKKRGKLING